MGDTQAGSMEEPAPADSKETPFYCHLCGVYCASALNLQSHFLGIKHRTVEEGLRTNNTTDPETPIELKPNESLQEQIDACKSSEPAVGLEYIYQYQKRGHTRYQCKLCDCKAGQAHMFMHIIGAKHRMSYLEKHHPSLGIRGPYIMRGPKKLKKLRDLCANVEKEFGRHKINVPDTSTWSWDIDPELVYYTPDAELEQMDFTSDDFFHKEETGASKETEETGASKETEETGASKETEETGASKETEGSKESEASKEITFLKLKAAYLSDLKKGVVMSVNRAEDKKEEKVEPPKEEPNKDFKTNQDLLEFLDHFRILEDGDAKFVNTVVEMMSLALVRHKTVSEEEERRKQEEQKAVSTAVPAHSKKIHPKTSFSNRKTEPVIKISLEFQKPQESRHPKHSAPPTVKRGNGFPQPRFPAPGRSVPPQVNRVTPFTEPRIASPEHSAPPQETQGTAYTHPRYGAPEYSEPHQVNQGNISTQPIFVAPEHSEPLQTDRGNPSAQPRFARPECSVPPQVNQSTSFTQPRFAVPEHSAPPEVNRGTAYVHPRFAAPEHSETPQIKSGTPSHPSVTHQVNRGTAYPQTRLCAPEHSAPSEANRGNPYPQPRFAAPEHSVPQQENRGTACAQPRFSTPEHSAYPHVNRGPTSAHSRFAAPEPSGHPQMNRGTNFAQPRFVPPEHSGSPQVNRGTAFPQPRFAAPERSAPPHFNQGTPFSQPRFTSPEPSAQPQVNRGTAFPQPRLPAPEPSGPPHLNRGAPSAQPRFPAPPLFPIAKDDIMNKFFESLKNMEVPEVVATLNKITATNPAFRGMHVPSLIKYLMDSGKLKPTQNVQQTDQ